MKKHIISLALISSPGYAAELPQFLDKEMLENAEFSCRNEPVKFSEEDMKYVKPLWEQSLVFLEQYAQSLTHSSGACSFSAEAITEMNTPGLKGPSRQCVMDLKEVQDIVRHIYTVIHNKDKAFQCFNPHKNDKELYGIESRQGKKSEIAEWLNRKPLKEYFKSMKEPEIRKAGMEFGEKFSRMITGPNIKGPSGTTQDITANGLFDLWASVGWIPMYSSVSERNENTGEGSFRGGYAYGEVMGHWGLLQIDKINGEPVGAEIGMTVQAMGTFYPYHYHNIPELYFTVRKPKCLNSIQQLIVSQNNRVLGVKDVSPRTRTIEFNGSQVKDVNHYWMSTTPDADELIFIPGNSVHAFDLKDSCETTESDAAHVTLWARGRAHESNDYGTTHVCQLSDSHMPKSGINRRDASVVCVQNRTIYQQ